MIDKILEELEKSTGRFGVISTHHVGVPIMPGEDTPYSQKVAQGLNTLFEKGWKYHSMLNMHLMVFERCDRGNGVREI